MSDATVTSEFLVVTSSPTLRALLEMSVEESGVIAKFVEKMQQGLDFLKGHTPRAIVLDDTAEADPFSVATRLKMSRRLREVPVIVLVQKSDERARLTAEIARVEHIITKPLDRKAFGSLLHRLNEAVPS
jgi:CheY-like chemotaxis protein